MRRQVEEKKDDSQRSCKKSTIAVDQFEQCLKISETMPRISYLTPVAACIKTHLIDTTT